MALTHRATPEIRILSDLEIEHVSGAKLKAEVQEEAEKANDAGKFSKGAAKLNLAG